MGYESSKEAIHIDEKINGIKMITAVSVMLLLKVPSVANVNHVVRTGTIAYSIHLSNILSFMLLS